MSDIGNFSRSCEYLRKAPATASALFSLSHFFYNTKQVLYSAMPGAKFNHANFTLSTKRNYNVTIFDKKGEEQRRFNLGLMAQDFTGEIESVDLQDLSGKGQHKLWVTEDVDFDANRDVTLKEDGERPISDGLMK